jgi:hypothetical protein
LPVGSIGAGIRVDPARHRAPRANRALIHGSAVDAQSPARGGLVHDGGVLCRRWRYECGSCRAEYFLPGVDLSFFYGTFLGVSRNAEAVVFDTFEDPIFDQIDRLVEAQLGPATSTGEKMERGDIIREIVTLVSDPDSAGSPFVFDGTPGCPACGSTKRARWGETDEPWPAAPGILTHQAWDSWSTEQRTQAVVGHLMDMGKMSIS